MALKWDYLEIQNHKEKINKSYQQLKNSKSRILYKFYFWIWRKWYSTHEYTSYESINEVSENKKKVILSFCLK